MSTVSTEKMMAQIACKAIDDKKGQDIKVIDIHKDVYKRQVLYQCAADTGSFPDSAYGKGARRIMSYRHWRRCMCI